MSNDGKDDSDLYLTAWYVLVGSVFIYIFGHLHPNFNLIGFIADTFSIIASIPEAFIIFFGPTIAIFAGIVTGIFFIWLVCTLFKILCERALQENTGGVEVSVWDSMTNYKKIYLQNRNKIKGSIDLKEYYKLVVEYNLCSCVERRSEIANIFTKRSWGKPFLKQFQRKPFKSEKAESNRKRIDQMRLLFLPCPECLTDIDCNDAKEGVTYSCHRCAAYYKFKNDVGLLIC
jgi:hypothetical protein